MKKNTRYFIGCLLYLMLATMGSCEKKEPLGYCYINCLCPEVDPGQGCGWADYIHHVSKSDCQKKLEENFAIQAENEIESVSCAACSACKMVWTED